MYLFSRDIFPPPPPAFVVALERTKIVCAFSHSKYFKLQIHRRRKKCCWAAFCIFPFKKCAFFTRLLKTTGKQLTFRRGHSSNGRFPSPPAGVKFLFSCFITESATLPPTKRPRGSRKQNGTAPPLALATPLATFSVVLFLDCLLFLLPQQAAACFCFFLILRPFAFFFSSFYFYQKMKAKKLLT